MNDPCVIDIYEGDGNTNLDAIASAPQPTQPTDVEWIGAMLKVSQGTYYNGGAWLARMYPHSQSLRSKNPKWNTIPYHYHDVSQGGEVQAMYYLSQVKRVTLAERPPFYVLDVERGGQRGDFTKQQILDSVTPAVQCIKRITNKEVVCYGGSYLRDNGITLAELGMDFAWVADYGAELTPAVYAPICPLSKVWGWQYAGLAGNGVEEVKLKGYPWLAPPNPPGVKMDITAVIINGGGQAAIDFMNQRAN